MLSTTGSNIAQSHSPTHSLSNETLLPNALTAGVASTTCAPSSSVSLGWMNDAQRGMSLGLYPPVSVPVPVPVPVPVYVPHHAGVSWTSGDLSSAMFVPEYPFAAAANNNRSRGAFGSPESLLLSGGLQVPPSRLQSQNSHSSGSDQQEQLLAAASGFRPYQQLDNAISAMHLAYDTYMNPHASYLSRGPPTSHQHYSPPLSSNGFVKLEPPNGLMTASNEHGGGCGGGTDEDKLYKGLHEHNHAAYQQLLALPSPMQQAAIQPGSWLKSVDAGLMPELKPLGGKQAGGPMELAKNGGAPLPAGGDCKLHAAAKQGAMAMAAAAVVANGGGAGAGLRGPLFVTGVTTKRRKIRLVDFLLGLLAGGGNPEMIRWENKADGVFRIVRSVEVARQWGLVKGRPDMTFEKMSRAIRFLRKDRKGFDLLQDPGRYPKKLVFRFSDEIRRRVNQ